MSRFNGSVVTLAPRKARPLWCGHPWVFARAIERVTGDPESGDVVLVCDDRDRPIDVGLWSGASSIRVRLLGRGWEPEVAEPPDPSRGPFWEEIFAAAARRRSLLGLPCPDTDCYRLANSEGDGAPGVIVDRFGAVAIVQLTTAATYAHIDAIYDGLRRAVDVETVVLRTDPSQAAREEMPHVERVEGPTPDAQVEVRERGIRFAIDVLHGQKTGHYADQRENRALVAGFAKDKRVFDGCCYTGGFALAAARAGATEVVAVDTSGPALERARVNAERNGVAELVRLEKGRAGDALRSAADRDELYDVVVLDPPKLAPDRRSVAGARKMYRALAIEGLRALAPEGVLFLASCSHAIGTEALTDVIAEAAGRVGRRVEVLARTENPPDHPFPAAMSEGRYLSGVLVQSRPLRGR